MAFSFADYNNEREFIEAESEFTILPDGEYQLMMESAEWKDTKRGDGRYLAIKWCVTAPDQFEGATLFDNLNLDNPNDQAVQIAKRRLKSIEDCGNREYFSEDDMPGTTVNARVYQDEYTDNNGNLKKSNRIKSYRPSDSGAVHVEPVQSSPAQPKPHAPAPQPKAQQPTPANHKPQPVGAGGSEAAQPWKRK